MRAGIFDLRVRFVRLRGCGGVGDVGIVGRVKKDTHPHPNRATTKKTDEKVQPPSSRGFTHSWENNA